MLSQVKLDRNGEISLYRQLRAAIEMAIIDGELPDGSPLPSVRRLATILNVAPITVVQAYRDLQAAELIRSVPKRGYFVSTTPTVDDRSGDAVRRVQLLIDSALDASAEAGLDSVQFLRLASERARRPRSVSRTVGVLGARDASLSERVDAVQDYVRDLDVTVVGLAVEDVGRLETEEIDALVRPIELLLVSVGEVQEAARLVGPDFASRIIPMTRVIRDDVRGFIDMQPPDAVFGVIASSPKFSERILAVLRRIHELQRPPIVVITSDSIGIRRAIDEADALLIGSLAQAQLTEFMPFPKPAMPFVSLPDGKTLESLRARLLGTHSIVANRVK